jgi:hypothetical protein
MFIVTVVLCGNLVLTVAVFYALIQSLEDELVRETILQLVSLKLWHTLSFGRLQVSRLSSLKIVLFFCVWVLISI